MQICEDASESNRLYYYFVCVSCSADWLFTFVSVTKPKSVNTGIRYGSILKVDVNRQSKKSYIGKNMELGIKTCSVDAALKFGWLAKLVLINGLLGANSC